MHNLTWGKCPFRLLEWPLSPPTGKGTLGFGADFLHDFISATGKSRKYSFFVILLLLPCIHASFRIESSVDDCQFDHAVDKIDWIYLGPIIACSVLTVFNLVFLCMIARAFKRVNPNAILFL